MTLILAALFLTTAIAILLFKKKGDIGVFIVIDAALLIAIGVAEASESLLDKLQKVYVYEQYPNWLDGNLIGFLGMTN
ncbi:hypothetical protein [Polynucleobacter sp. es-MAR-4]|uniref:hypothetical protein n=1 Tax=Polynucleobacter sp. es-MAR-4 TaxID=1855655 RepID=UPI001C0D3ACC|nr:hypothetical protein [Polynucleobacter sp. es-MAR-4]MBU3637921.1 hypothetical protein [Polynucleobacter sp. es-MAR-4]